MRISVPASSANLGPGFDCLALALELRLTAEVAWSGDRVKLHDFTSPLAWWAQCVAPFRSYSGTLVDFDDELIEKPNLFAVSFFKAVVNAGPEYNLPARLEAKIHSDVPIGQGLGSSAAAVVAGAAIAESWRKGAYDAEQVFQAAVEIEGHADNAAAAAFGGLQAALLQGRKTRGRSLPWHSSLKVALCVPSETLKENTSATRRWLPENLKRTEAVSNQRSLLTLLYGLETGDGDAIAAGFEDRLHVPHRKAMIAGYEDIVGTAREAGAFGATISGAGGSMIAIGNGDMAKVAGAMAEAYRRHGMEARPMTPEVAKQGLNQEPGA
ncbi:MAG: homoserine kinase [Planctomycetes bacterium]|nr:homoserine kinase [Planctomycetota bacterium]